ncbi:MAG: primase [Sphingomonadales bacterium]|nr:primase [Sphingomonadales bacterium]
MISPQFLDELRTRTMLSALIGRTLKLERAGREFKACCPFHNEKSPSFYVNDDKAFYHCFGCSAHGDAIRWLTEAKGLPFMDAVKELAAAAGMDVPAPDPRAAERAEVATPLYDVMTAAQNWFVEQLAGIAGSDARAYLNQRGIDAATATAFGIGFAPDSRSKLKAALASYGNDKLIESGLLISVEEKDPYDRFRGRLMIPIRDPRGRVIAFGGRILGPGEPKYLNSPDTPLFDKGRTLYNLDRAGGPARKADRLIVVEGYMDAIALSQAGVEEVVAPLGTALTEFQLERLWRLVDVPLLCFDGDSAGQKAAMRAAVRALPMLAPGKSLGFVLLPTGKDPDDLVRSGGRKAVEAVFDAAHPLVEHIWQTEYDAAPLRTPEAKAGFKHRIDAHVATIADPDVRRHYQREMRERFDAAFFAERERRPFIKGKPFQKGVKRRDPQNPPLDSVKAMQNRGIDPMYERPIMAGLIFHPSIVLTCGETLSSITMSDMTLDLMRNVLLEAAYDGDLVEIGRVDTICQSAGLSDVLEELRSSNSHNRLAFSFLRSNAEPERARRDLAMLIEAATARPELAEALAAATARVAAGGDEESFAEQARLNRAFSEAKETLMSLMGYDDD